VHHIGREEKAAAADKVSPIVRHRASVAQLQVMESSLPHRSKYRAANATIARQEQQSFVAAARWEPERGWKGSYFLA
jgi:hypothetical protein